MDRLAKYDKLRDFGATAEPKGRVTEAAKRAHVFVVQKHHASRLHYDFRLSIGGVLVSWAVPKGPSLDPSQRRLAVRTEDHPYDYRTFEGVIPPGEYGAGKVIVWDAGDYVPLNLPEGLADEYEWLDKGSIYVELHGKKLKGRFKLIRMEGRGENNWLLIKGNDEFAVRGGDVTKEEPLSVVSGKDVDDIE
jgi:bifunctional non-homologous end joining protein LigD